VALERDARVLQRARGRRGRHGRGLSHRQGARGAMG
jgi:hypothetical protein